MKVGIIQLSDLHIASSNDYIVKNAEVLARGCKQIINSCNKVVVVVTGDIIDKGNVSNYAYAEKMFDTIKSELMKEASLESYEYVFVPGNHDIDFESEEDVRPVVINEIHNRDAVEENQFVEICLKPQQCFWEFVSKMEGVERKPCVSYSKVIPINDKSSLVFQCYNSAFLSTKSEEPQQLIIPENYFIDYNAIDDNRKDIVISVFHHKTGWLATRTANNNQYSFCQHIEKTSQVLMCGHEHQRGHKVISDLENVDKILYLESNSLQQGNEQSFEVLTIDDNEGPIIHPYEIVLVENGRIDIFEEVPQEVKFKKHALSFTQKYNTYLSKLDAPIKHPVKKELFLDDIFVYPDLEPLATLDQNRMYPYVDSINLIKNTNQENIVILEGESQCGKTSLLKMLVRQCYQNGVYPILIKGDAMNVVNLNGVLKDAFNWQYEGKKMGYNQYMQMERQKRVVFIDNLDKSSLNQESLKLAFKQILDNYDFIVATAATDNSVLGLLQKSRGDSVIKRYIIHPLGYVKRNQLIERWILLGANQQTMKTNKVADKINSIFNMFSNILGKQLMPSNPIFLLILLQEVNIAFEPYDVEPTSYASLYRSLLMSALHKQEVPHNNFDGVIQFLSKIAYIFYKTRKFTIKKDYQVDGEIGFSQFYDEYVKDWNMPYTKDKLLEILVNSQLLSEKEPECYCFAYKYIYFYLVANYISSIKDEKQKKEEIKFLCSKLYKEEHGNILIFMSYLVSDPYLMEEIKFASWLPFEDRDPITLDRTDVLYQRLEEIVNNVSNEVLRTDVDHAKMRQKMLEAKDKNLIEENQGRKEIFKPTDEDFEKDKNLRDINNMLKANRIIGQIIKNQRDTLPKDQIVDMLSDAYLASFRTLSFFTDLLKADQSDIVNDLIAKDENLRKLGLKDVTDRVNALFQMMLMRTCLITFSNLTLSVGTPGIKTLYDKVAKEKIKSPAADVITFSIKSYFEPMKDEDLEDIVKKYKNNPVVMNIIRARVRNYVYTHNLPHDRMQRIGSITGMKLINTPSRLIAKKNK